MVFKSKIPTSDGNELEIPIAVGRPLFVLGANGVGKSSLMQKIYALNHGNASRITAHRQTWFSSNAISFSPQQKKQHQQNIENTDAAANSRWKDDYASQRTGIAVFDLLDAENVRARKIAQEVDRGDIIKAKLLSNDSAPIAVINDLLLSSGIPIILSIEKNESIVASKRGSNPYSIAELSDGERNALLIAASVLTAKSGSLILIDEPERHLHRSIISPFLTQLFSERGDCAFVISTHDLSLPFDSGNANCLLIRDCVYNGGSASAWSADLLVGDESLDDNVMYDVLGARKKIIFVEGEESSLDKSLYLTLFPDASVVAKESCKDVISHVRSIRSSSNLHWIMAFGIVDSDNMSPQKIDDLRTFGVYALKVYSVEGLYYHPEIQRLLAERHAVVTGADLEATLNASKAAALSAITPHVPRLAARMIEGAVRAELLSSAPTWSQIGNSSPISIQVDAPGLLASEIARLDELISAGDLAGIVARYPVRETPMIQQVVDKLGFKDRAQYEAAVRKLLTDDQNAKDVMFGFFGTLVRDLSVN